MSKSKILISAIFIFSLTFCLTSFAKAENASLYLSPGNGTFFVGSTFDVSIFVNTDGNNINAVKADLKFDPKKLQIVSPTTGKSFVSVWISQPEYSNIEGTVSFQGGTPSPGINTSAGLISTITFRAITPGETIISVFDSSQVLLDDGEGTNILSSIGRVKYEISLPPPEGPKIFSSTHPDQNEWYKNNSPVFNWEKEEGVTEFSYNIGHDFYNTPDNISEGSQTSASYADLEDGIWYFNLKAKSGKSWGEISHYLIQIDVTPPADFKINFDPPKEKNSITAEQTLIYFFTTDALSGIDHSVLKIIKMIGNTEEETGTFLEAISPYKLPGLEEGEYKLIARIYDKAMNYRDVSEKIMIASEGKEASLENILLNRNKLILISLIFIIIIAAIIFLRNRRRKKPIEVN